MLGFEKAQDDGRCQKLVLVMEQLVPHLSFGIDISPLKSDALVLNLHVG
jgi:hypothetical protein